MDVVKLGKTGIIVPKNGFGALPIQRINKEEAVYLLQKAYNHGLRFFDTARAYSDSEEKIGLALKEVRSEIIIASKTMAKDVKTFWEHLNTSLEMLQTDYIDIFQFHTPAFCPKPGDGTGLYEAMLEAKEKGIIKHIGMTNHRLSVAREAIESGLYETIQFPFSYLSIDCDLELVDLAKKYEVGFIAMKGLSGGLINKADVAYAYLSEFCHVLPIWGVQSERELDDFLECHNHPVRLTKERLEIIENDRKELAGNFCRGCGYCMPCPVGIQINNCARMSLMIRRAPSSGWLSAVWQENMGKIKDCIHCNLCSKQCPYGLNTPQLLEDNLVDYQNILAGEISV
jgi:Predicted oxidoreductases of the aldo/keto reductase family